MIGSSRFDFKYPLAKGVHRAAVHWNDWLVGMAGSSINGVTSFSNFWPLPFLCHQFSNPFLSYVTNFLTHSFPKSPTFWSVSFPCHQLSDPLLSHATNFLTLSFFMLPTFWPISQPIQQLSDPFLCHITNFLTHFFPKISSFLYHFITESPIFNPFFPNH